MLAEDKPDLLHTFAALVGVLHLDGLDFDFALFMKPQPLKDWAK